MGIPSVNSELPKTVKEAQQYFEHHPDLMSVKQLAVAQAVPSERLNELNGRCFHVKAPIKVLASYVVDVICSLADALGASDLSKRCYVLSSDLCSDSRLIDTTKLYGSALKMPVWGMHRSESADIFLQQTPSPLYDANSFFHPRGMCRGICDWFFFLYFKTHSHFTSSKKQIMTIGRLFERGAPDAAALIQSMKAEEVSWKALKLKVRMDVLQADLETTPIQTICKKIYRLPKGAYGLYFAGNTVHRINYIRTSSNQRFVLNPQALGGLLQISNQAQLIQAMNIEAAGRRSLAVDRVSL